MLIQGIFLGISLSFLIGPLLFAIVEAGISQGFRAGVSVASGIWASDVLYVLLAFYGIEAMEALVALPDFKLWAGMMGGILLTAFGLGSLLKSRRQVAINALDLPKTSQKSKTYLWWWVRGFLLNTINPGTVFFWLGIVSAVVVPSGWTKQEMLVFFGGMMGTLVITDTAKAWAAKKLRKFLTPRHTAQIQSGIGWLMIIFGVFLGIRSFF